MRARSFAGLLLAAVMGACPLLASYAAVASAERHACCPAPADSRADDCCIRAAAPPSAAFAAPRLVFLAVLDPAPAVAAPADVRSDEESSLSPPGEPSLLGRPSRAPPAVLA